MARAETSAILEAAEHASYGPKILAEVAPAAASAASMGRGPNVGISTLSLVEVPIPSGSSSSDTDGAARQRVVEQRLRCEIVDRLAEYQGEGKRLAAGAGDGMDLGFAPA